MSADVSQLRAFAVELGKVPAEVTVKVLPVVKKGAVNIRKAMQADFRKSRHFSQIARSINFDVNTDGAGVEAEIGPDKSVARAGAPLAHIAYWGGANGGGGTVRDPAQALADEAPRFESELGKLLDGIL